MANKLTYEEYTKYEIILSKIEEAEFMIRDSDLQKRAFYVETLGLGDTGNAVADAEVEYWEKTKKELEKEKEEMEKMERNREKKDIENPVENEEKEEFEEEDIEEEEEEE